jgi:rhamnogalacturonan endolyase
MPLKIKRRMDFRRIPYFFGCPGTTAYDWDGATISQKWYYNAGTKGQEYYSQGNHNLTTGDVEGDGKDEIIEDSCAVDRFGLLQFQQHC